MQVVAGNRLISMAPVPGRRHWNFAGFSGPVNRLVGSGLGWDLDDGVFPPEDQPGRALGSVDFLVVLG